MMKIGLRVVVGWVVLALGSAALADDCSKMAVTGTAKQEFEPDAAYITLYVIGDGILMVDAVKKADENTEAVLKAIREGREEITDITVKALAVGEKNSRYWGPEKEGEAPRPQITKQLRVTIPPRPELAHSIIDAAIRAGALFSVQSSVQYPGEMTSAVVYGLTDGQKRADDLKGAAVANARDEGAKMAALVGKKLGSVCSVGCYSTREVGHEIYFPGRRTEYPTEYVGMDPQSIEVEASVSVTFDLLDE